MTLLHLSLPAADPEAAARVLARILGGPAHPFPPCPGAWIAFAAADDGTAVELYPHGTRVERGPEAIRFATGPREAGGAAHAALATALPAAEVVAIAAGAGWPARICDRGPFRCVEFWIDGGRLVEVLDPSMLSDYRAGMTAAAWRGMFGLEEED